MYSGQREALTSHIRTYTQIHTYLVAELKANCLDQRDKVVYARHSALDLRWSGGGKLDMRLKKKEEN